MKDTIVSHVDLFEINHKHLYGRSTMICMEDFGFFLCKNGCITLMMDEHTYCVSAGDLFIYPAFSQIAIKEFSHDVNGITGKADFKLIFSSLDSVADTQMYVYLRAHPMVRLTQTQYTCINKLIESIRERKQLYTRLKQPIIAALAQALCYEMVDACITNSREEVISKKQSRKDLIFQNFLATLHREFRIHRDVGFYAQLQNLTPRHFSTMIHKASGKMPLQWISLFVITEAKKLLADPKTSIKEVSEQLHFSEQSFFGRYFKQHTGFSPSHYKKISAKPE